eukprot:3559090-Amphidinium_carterae.1
MDPVKTESTKLPRKGETLARILGIAFVLRLLAAVFALSYLKFGLACMAINVVWELQASSMGHTLSQSSTHARGIDTPQSEAPSIRSTQTLDPREMARRCSIPFKQGNTYTTYKSLGA